MSKIVRGLGSYGRLVFEYVADTTLRPAMVADMVTSTGHWDWDLLKELLPETVLDYMAETSPPLAHLGDDMPG
ncbi:hypothetical protein V6N11_059558 [Hibiscus sabdariffa]|uniref:Uncharacterized protein n=1 Tax=Hibiscus sabdariffa TaxID=183260 RepID=A0ABR2NP31_9ROSI